MSSATWIWDDAFLFPQYYYYYYYWWWLANCYRKKREGANPTSAGAFLRSGDLDLARVAAAVVVLLESRTSTGDFDLALAAVVADVVVESLTGDLERALLS